MRGPIAIVGISVELPSGSYSKENLDHELFFQFLLDGGQSYERMPPGRINIDAWKGNNPGEIHVDTGSFLKDIDLFDNVEFGISSKDARNMAPATKKLLENCFLALLDSGIDYRNKNVGCYTSATGFDLTNVTDPDEYEARGSFAGYPAMVANRISNHLDLLGPSVPTDTACSSTLTALHLAVQAILNRECDAAVVGGCQLNHRFIDWFMYSQGSLLAGDGKCKPFDASADGFARAEGCVAIVIKPLEDAVKDFDRIYATILATAINSSGGGGPPNAPVAEAQRNAMIQAFKRAERMPQTVDYIELHATGTAKGDPTEANWVGAEFLREDELLIGSVKGNIGHTEIVAFLASLSKVLSIFEHGIIPPNVNLQTLNPAINWRQYNLRVPMVPTPLPSHCGGKQLIAMASSGIGGSNGHIVLEAPPPMEKWRQERPSQEGIYLLMAGGLSTRSTVAIADSVGELVAEGPCEPSALSVVLGRRAKQMTWRAFTVVDTNTSELPQFSSPQLSPRIALPLVFVFSGQGPQHANMGRQLYKTFPAFRNSILEMDDTYKAITKKSIVHDHGLFGDESMDAIEGPWPISLILPSIAMFQIALFDLLVSLGIKPDIVVGHSAGETALLYASGAGTKSAAIELAIARGAAFLSLEELGGAMAALSCGPDDASRILEKTRVHYPDSVLEIACFNSPSAVAIAGHDAAVMHAVRLAQAQGLFGQKIRTRVPIHSSMMDHCRDVYCKSLEELFSKYHVPLRPSITTYSTVTGKLFEGPFDANYFWTNTRSPVRFTEVIQSVASSGAFTVIELAPHPVLSMYLNSMVPDSSTVLSTVRRPKPGNPPSEHVDILTLCGLLTSAGYNGVDFAALNGRASHEACISLPAYPFSKKQFPLYPNTYGYAKQIEAHAGPLNHKYLKVNKDTHPILGEHVIRGEPIMPAAGFIEMALEFGATTIINVKLQAILSLSAETPVAVDVHRDELYWTVVSKVSPKSQANLGNTTLIEKLHADGYLSFEPSPDLDIIDIPTIRSRCPEYVSSSFYRSLSYFSSYGSHLRRVTNVYYGSGEALVSLRGMDEILTKSGKYVIHPAILDACLHITAYRPFHGNFDSNVYYLPAGVGCVIVHNLLRSEGLPIHLYAYVVMQNWTPATVRYDIILLNSSGRRLCTLRSLEVAKHYMHTISHVSRPCDLVYQHAFIPPWSQKLEESMANSSPSADYDAELCHAQGLRTAMSSLASHDSRRVTRIFLLASSISNSQTMSKVLKEFPHIFCEVFLNSEQEMQVMAIEPEQGVLRNSIQDSDICDRTDQYDIVSCFAVEAIGDLEIIIRTCNRLLNPGGTLILTTKRDTLGSTWICNSGPKSCCPVDPYHNCLKDVFTKGGFTLMNVTSDDLGDTLTIESQRSTTNYATVNLWNSVEEQKQHVIHYVEGRELDLQRDLRALDVSEGLNIWILATEHCDGGSILGLTRALRREYVSWTIRLLLFPPWCSKEMREGSIHRLSPQMKDETEILISSRGDILVPRLVPLPRVEPGYTVVATKDQVVDEFLSGKVTVNIRASWSFGTFSGFFGSIVNSDNTTSANNLVVGLSKGNADGITDVECAAVHPVSSKLTQYAITASACLPGLVVAILASGPSAFAQLERLRSYRILLTHSDTPIGRSFYHAYEQKGIQVVQLKQNATILELTQSSEVGFHLIVSGYTDTAHTQILQSLLCRQGRVFLWNASSGGLFDMLDKSPWSIGDALVRAIPLLEESIPHLHVAIGPLLRPPEQTFEKSGALMQSIASRAVYDATKTYLLLGGIGSVGVHVALHMYERGARQIVLTSRRGERSLEENANPMVRRMLSYMNSLDGLRIRLVAVDATSLHDMRNLVDTLPSELGGCMILTAVLSDRTFHHMSQADFSTVYSAKTGVLSILEQVVEVSRLDFLVAFSSMSGLIGFGGQSNYGAANTALEKAISRFPNAFSFVCPGILDSSLLLVGKDDTERARFRHAVEWSISMEHVIILLDDAIFRFQRGQRFSRYIPDMSLEAQDRIYEMPVVGQHLVVTKRVNDVLVDDGVHRLGSVVRNVLNIAPADFSTEVPFTAYGIDSLSASKLSILLRPFVEVTQLQLLANITFADLLRKASVSSSQAPETGNTTSVDQPENLLQDFLAKYTKDLGMHSASPERRIEYPIERTSDDVIILTGSTGALGCNILSRLIADDSVRQVYALNRKRPGSAPLLQRQLTALSLNGLSQSIANSPKLILVECDFGAPNLGLGEEETNQLLSSVTHIIHNAWRVDFYSPIEEFKDLIETTCALLKLAKGSTRKTPPSMSLISTIAVFQHHDESSPAPEAPIPHPTVVMGSGYTESKWVAERLTQMAAERLSLNTTVIRVGLLTGSPNGYWDTSHWFPALVQSALYLGCLPEGNDLISWMPVNTAAAAIVDVRNASYDTVHIVHPRPVTWGTIMEPLAAEMKVPLVPYVEWFARLESATAEQSSAADSSSDARAASRLLHYFRKGLESPGRSMITESMGLLPRVATEKGLHASPTLMDAGLEQLGACEMEKWLAYWREVGFLPPVSSV